MGWLTKLVWIHRDFAMLCCVAMILDSGYNSIKKSQQNADWVKEVTTKNTVFDLHIISSYRQIVHLQLVGLRGGRP